MVVMKVIQPERIELASSVVFATRKDRTLTIRVDYGSLNAGTIRDAYPLPMMDECIDSLEDTGVISTLNANSGVRKTRVDPSDRAKISFTPQHGL